MGFFNDWRSHYAAGYLYGLTLRAYWPSVAIHKIRELDKWAWEREWKQNLAGQNPNDPMSPHQVEEAKAWGKGARKACRLNPPYPVPPYYPE